MKILYGIQTNGNGHITRAQQVIEELIKHEHTVDIITSGQNSQLKLNHPVLKSFEGLTFRFDSEGGINWVQTVLHAKLIQLIKDINFDSTKYDLVISDFEPISAWCAKKTGIKSVSLSNQCSLSSPHTPKPTNRDWTAELFMKHFAPCAQQIGLHYLSYDDFIFQPIIRNQLLSSKPRNNNFYLVYLTSASLETQIRIFEKNSSLKWKIYTNQIPSSPLPLNIEVKKPSLADFTNDLIQCNGVITASGFATTSESLVLKKKLWSIPVKRQYEQYCNAAALMQLGVFTKEFSPSNLAEWTQTTPIDYKWQNPLPQIISKIESF